MDISFLPHNLNVVFAGGVFGSAALANFGLNTFGSLPDIRASYRLEYWQKVNDTILTLPIRLMFFLTQ